MAKPKGSGMVEGDCPVPETHQRLARAHRLWHDALRGYNDPADFVTYLNSTIQELRNVTFVLQKERSVPEFDGWYAGWQASLRNSIACRWIVEARNHIVKQGDLDVASKIYVNLVDSYRQRQPFEMPPLPPTVPLTTVAAMAARTVPERLRRNAAITVERRWEVVEFPQAELLDLVADAYGQLAALVRDAHAKADRTYVPTECGGSEPRGLDRPTCMNPSARARTAFVNLSTNEAAQLARKSVTLNRDNLELQSPALRARYGTITTMPEGDALASKLLWTHELACKMLKADGYLRKFTHLFREGKSLGIFGFEPRDRTEKYLMWRSVADDVRRTGADELVTFSETWLVRADSLKSGLEPAQVADREEGVHTVAASADGRVLSVTTKFRHVDGAIEMDRRGEVESGGVGFLEPVLEVWRKRQGWLIWRR